MVIAELFLLVIGISITWKENLKMTHHRICITNILFYQTSVVNVTHLLQHVFLTTVVKCRTYNQFFVNCSDKNYVHNEKVEQYCENRNTKISSRNHSINNSNADH